MYYLFRFSLTFVLFQVLSESTKLDSEYSETILKEKQIEKEAKVKNELIVAINEKKKNEDLLMGEELSVAEKKQIISEKVCSLEADKNQFEDEAKKLSESEAHLDKEEKAILELMKELERKKLELSRQSEETRRKRSEIESKTKSIVELYNAHIEEVQRLDEEEQRLQDERTSKEQKLKKERQLIAERSCVDEVYVESPAPQESLITIDEDVDKQDESNRFVLANEDTMEKAVVEDDIMTDTEKEIAIENRQKFIREKEKKEAEREAARLKKEEAEARAAQLAQDRAFEQQARDQLQVEDDLSRQNEANFKKVNEIRAVYQTMLNDTLQNVMNAVMEKRRMEIEEEQFMEDCHNLVSKQLKVRYNRLIQGLIRKEESKNQSQLSPDHVKQLWRIEDEQLSSLCKLMRSQRKLKRELTEINSSHREKVSAIEANYSKQVDELTMNLVNAKMMIDVLDKSLRDETAALKEANITIAGESGRISDAVTLGLKEQARQLDEYKRSLPAMETQTGEDEELLAAHSEIAKLKGEAESLNEKLVDVNYELESVQSELADLKAEFANATEEYTDAVTTVRDHRDKAKFLAIKLEAAEVEIERINKERSTIAQELDERANHQRDLENQCHESSTNVKSLQSEVEKLTEQKNAAIKSKKDMKRRLGEMKKKLDEKTQDSTRLTDIDSSQPQDDASENGDSYDDYHQDDNANINDEVITDDAGVLSPDRQSKIENKSGELNRESKQHQLRFEDECGREGSTSPRLLPSINKKTHGNVCLIISFTSLNYVSSGGEQKQFGRLLHTKEKKATNSPEKQSKLQRKYQKYLEKLNHQKNLSDIHDNRVGEVIESNDGVDGTAANQKSELSRKQKGQKVSCTECQKRVLKADVKKLPCVLKNLRDGKKITPGKMNYSKLNAAILILYFRWYTAFR